MHFLFLGRFATLKRMKRLLSAFSIGLLCLLALFVLPTSVAAVNSPCDFVTDANNSACTACMGEGKTGVWTAFGCLPTTSGEFATTLIQFGSGLAGGIAFLLIIVGGFQMVMSAGNPEKLNAGKELVSSAIVGLLFIIFSVFLLRMIGVEILVIPGFE